MEITDVQFAGVIALSMPTPSWDPVIGTLGGELDPKVIISQLNTEWNRRQGLNSTGKDLNVVFQTSRKTLLQFENCNKTGHTKTKCWAKGGRQEGQYPDWFKGKKDAKSHNTVKTITETPIVWMYGSNKSLEMWIVS